MGRLGEYGMMGKMEYRKTKRWKYWRIELKQMIEGRWENLGKVGENQKMGWGRQHMGRSRKD